MSDEGLLTSYRCLTWNQRPSLNITVAMEFQYKGLHPPHYHQITEDILQNNIRGNTHICFNFTETHMLVRSLRIHRTAGFLSASRKEAS